MSQSTSSPNGSRGPGLAVGVGGILMGTLVISIAFGFIHTVQTKASNPTPPWVMAIFGGAFILAGVWAIFLRLINQETSRARRLDFFFGLVIMLAITVICLWVGFGPGRCVFVQDVGIGVIPTTRPVDMLTGRVFFGGFGVLMAVVTAAFAWLQGRKLLGKGKPSA